MKWHTARSKAREGDREEPDDWDPPVDLEHSWKVWTLLESTGWRHLPVEGGLLDQPELLLEDLAVISWLSSIVEEQIGA